MSQVTYQDASEKVEKKKVLFVNGTGSSVTLRTGYALCYNQDYGTASDAELGRIWRVEQPATANLLYFAGVLAPGYDGLTVADGATLVVEICVPNTRGQGVEVWCEENCTINSTFLAVENGKFALGAAVDGYCVALAAQTVDRSSTNGTVFARLFGVSLVQTGIESEIAAAESELTLVSQAQVADASQLVAYSSEDSRILVLESQMSQAESRILVVESEAASNDSEILLLESECSSLESDLLVEKSTVNDVSEALSVALSRILVVESEAASNDSEILLLESEVASNDSEILLLESECADNASEILVLNSEMSQVQSRILLVESETASIADSDTIASGILTTSSINYHYAQITFRGVTYNVVTEIEAKA